MEHQHLQAPCSLSSGGTVKKNRPSFTNNNLFLLRNARGWFVLTGGFETFFDKKSNGSQKCKKRRTFLLSGCYFVQP